MSGAVNILEQIERLGVRMTARDDRLILEPGSLVPSDLLAQVREHKPELMKIVRAKAVDGRRQSQEVVALRARLSQLRGRIDKGLEVLQARVQEGRTGGPYPLWLETWERLLDEYTSTADKLASSTGCPIGDCSRMGECKAAPAACPAVGEGNTHAL